MDAELMQALAPRVRVARIVVVLMVLGIVVAAAVALAVAGMPRAKADQPPIFSYVALVLVPLHLAMSLFVSRAMLRAVRRLVANGPLVLTQQGQTYQQVRDLVDRLGERGWFVALVSTRAVVLGSLIEMAALINVAAYFVEQQAFSLIAAGVLAVILLLQMPTLNSTAQWVEDQGRRLEDERRLAAMSDAKREAAERQPE